MKKTIAKSVAFVLVSNTLGFSISQASGDIINAHACQVTKKQTHQVIQAVCGKKAMPDKSDGQLYQYRTFNDPDTDEIIEQYRLPNNDIRTIKEKKKTSAPAQKSAEPEESRSSLSAQQQSKMAEAVAHQNQTESSESDSNEGWSTGQKVLTIGAAVVGVVGAVIGIRAMVKKGGTTAEGKTRDEETAKNSRGSKIAGRMVKDPILKQMPKKIKISADVPGVKPGTRVKVAGAVRSADVPASVPRFRTSSGQTYIIQQNPDTGLLETLLIYQMLSRPYYYPGSYVYDSYGYSPFAYGTNNTVIVENQYLNNFPSYDATSYDQNLSSSRVTEADTSAFRSGGSRSDYTVTSDRTTSYDSSDYVTTSDAGKWSASSSSSSSSDYTNSSSDYSSGGSGGSGGSSWDSGGSGGSGGSSYDSGGSGGSYDSGGSGGSGGSDW